MRRPGFRQESENRRGDRDLERYFAPLKEADYGDTFETTRAWLERAERRQQDRHAQQQPLGGRIFDYVRGHRVRLALTSLLLALVFAACNIPVVEEETLGYTLSGRFRPESAREVMDEVHGLDWVKEVRWGMVRGAAADRDSQGPLQWLTFVILLPDAALGEVESQMRELEAIAGVSSLETRPMTVEVKRPLYKAAVPPAWRPPAWKASIRLNDTISDAEVERAVEEHLEQLQIHEVEVEIERGEDGTRELVLSSPSWTSLRDEGLQQIEQLQREVQPHAAEGAGLGFTLSGKFPPPPSPTRSWSRFVRGSGPGTSITGR